MTLIAESEVSQFEVSAPGLHIEFGAYRDCSGWWQRYCAQSDGTNAVDGGPFTPEG